MINFEPLLRRSLERSLNGLAGLKKSALRDLAVSEDKEVMRRSFAILRLVREIRRDRIRDYRKASERHRKQRERDEASALYMERLREGQVTPEEQRAHRQAQWAYTQEAMNETRQMMEEMSEKIAWLKERQAKRNARSP